MAAPTIGSRRSSGQSARKGPYRQCLMRPGDRETERFGHPGPHGSVRFAQGSATVSISVALPMPGCRWSRLSDFSRRRHALRSPRHSLPSDPRTGRNVAACFRPDPRPQRLSALNRPSPDRHGFSTFTAAMSASGESRDVARRRTRRENRPFLRGCPISRHRLRSAQEPSGLEAFHSAVEARKDGGRPRRENRSPDRPTSPAAVNAQQGGRQVQPRQACGSS